MNTDFLGLFLRWCRKPRDHFRETVVFQSFVQFRGRVYSKKDLLSYFILILAFAVAASLIVGAVYVGLLYRGLPLWGEVLLNIKGDFLNTFSLLLMVFVPLVTIYNSFGRSKRWEETAVFRLGRFHRFTNNGFFFKLPFLEQAISRDQRPSTLERSNQKFIGDDFEVTLDSKVHFRVVDTVKNMINMNPFPDSLGKLFWTTYKDAIPELKHDYFLFNNKEVLERTREGVQESMSKATQDWGIEIIDIEIKNIQSKAIEPRKERERISALGSLPPLKFTASMPGSETRCIGCLYLKFNELLKLWECTRQGKDKAVQIYNFPKNCHLFKPKLFWETEGGGGTS